MEKKVVEFKVEKVGKLSLHKFGGYVSTEEFMSCVINFFDEYGCVFTSVISPVTGDEGILDIYDEKNPQNSGTVYVHAISERVNILSFMKGDYKKEGGNV